MVSYTIKTNVISGKGDLQIKLGKWLEDKSNTWETALQYVTHAINISTATTTSGTPYKVVFVQKPHQGFYLLQVLAKQVDVYNTSKNIN